MKHIDVIDCDTALNRLMAGNQEYLIAKEGKGNISEEIRILTHEYGQKPYAIVIACSGHPGKNLHGWHRGNLYHPCGGQRHRRL